jgi:serine protease Do/serine protease DegQ
MIARLIILFSSLLTAIPGLAALPPVVDNKPLPSLAPVLNKAIPAVVNINTETRIKIQEHPLFQDPFFRHFFNLPDQPRERSASSLGSGVIVDAGRGYVITNYHVIGKADTISVTLSDGRSFKAELVGSDPATDITVLKIPAEQLTAVPLANSDQLQVGDFVVAIGNPFGLGQTVTSGIISALGRHGLGIGAYEDYIQTDASINPGNSGGALINLRGELVGINNAIYAPGGKGNIGIGFAIPANMVKSVMGQLIEFGKIDRGRLGAQAQDLTPELAAAFDIQGSPRGAVVVDVTSGSPADKAGLQVGDIVTRVNDKAIDNADDLRNSIGLMRVGDSVVMQVLRQGRRMTLKTRVAESRVETIDGGKLHSKLAGLQISNIPDSSPIYGRVRGIQVTGIKPGSPAAGSSLRKGDIITSVNRVKIDSPRQAIEVARENPGRILLNVRRGNSALFLLIQ